MDTCAAYIDTIVNNAHKITALEDLRSLVVTSHEYTEYVHVTLFSCKLLLDNVTIDSRTGDNHLETQFSAL